MVFDTQFSKLKRRMTLGVLAAFMVAYFAFHAFHGNYGIFARERYVARIGEQEIELKSLQQERAALEHRVALLKSDSLDPDMLEERVRETLGYSHPNDVMILKK